MLKVEQDLVGKLGRKAIDGNDDIELKNKYN